MDGDSNDKPTAMQSRSVARSHHWTTVSIGTGSLSVPNVNSTNDNQPRKRACCGTTTRVHPHLPRLMLNQYTTWLAVQSSSALVERKSEKVRMDSGWDPTAGLFSGLIVVSTVNIWCTKRSSPYRYYRLISLSIL